MPTPTQRSMVPNQKVLVVPLFLDVFLQTDGTATAIFIEAEAPELVGLGPYIESMYTLMITRNRTTNHLWGIYGSTSISGRTFSTPALISAETNVNGELILSPAFSSPLTTFGGLQFKVLAGTRNSTGGARESATVSAWLIVTLKT